MGDEWERGRMIFKCGMSEMSSQDSKIKGR